MTNLWLWNYDRNPWKLSGIDTFYSTRKYSRNLKFELNSRKIGLVLLRDGTWYTWTFSLPSTWVQLPWWKIVRCFKSGLHCTRLYIALKAQKLLEVFWSFLKLYLYIQIETFMYAITSHKKRRAKNQTEMLSRIAKQQFRYKQCFQRNNTLTADTDDQKFNCDNADGQSQTGNRKKINVGKLNSKDKPWEQRLREGPWDFVLIHTVDRTLIFFILLWIWHI